MVSNEDSLKALALIDNLQGCMSDLQADMVDTDLVIKQMVDVLERLVPGCTIDLTD